jgi:hypothetical protein
MGYEGVLLGMSWDFELSKEALDDDRTESPEPFKKGEAHLRIAGVFTRCWCVSAVGGKSSLPLAEGHPLLSYKPGDVALAMAIFHLPFARSAGQKGTVPSRRLPTTRAVN